MIKLISIFFVLIPVIVPIFTPFFMYPKLQDYVMLPKAIYTTISCFYILLAAMIYLRSKAIRNIIANKKIRLIEALAFLYLILLIISTVLSIDVNRSIIGAPWRYEGIISLINYIVIFFVIANFYRFKRIHLIFIGISAAIISIHSILYYFNIHIIPLSIASIRGKAGAMSLVGNQNFLGSYITLILPLFIYIFIKLGSKSAFILDGLLFAALICSLTRSGYVAFAFYFTFFIIYFLRKKKYTKRLIVLSISFIFIFGLLNITQSNNLLYRILSIKNDTVSFVKNGADNAGSNRSFIWKNGITLVPKYALHGSGPDTFDIPFMENFSEDAKRVFKGNTIVDKAHNEYLQIAVTLGIPALLTYLAFIGIILLRSVKLSKSRSFLIPLNIAFISYLIQAFFNISVVSVAPLYWALLGVICSYLKNDADLIESSFL
jgi:O-antigen ligase